MGYETTYNGSIKLSNKDVEKKLEEFIESVGDIYEYFGFDDIEICDGKVIVGGYAKIYDDELEEFCSFIAKVDEGAFGEIECNGEDSDDYWRVIIKKGGVFGEQGYIAYDEDSRRKFNGKKFNKDVYKITKDKKLIKELIVEELEDES